MNFGRPIALLRVCRYHLSWIQGRHTFKFGMDAQKIRAVSALGFFGTDNYGGFVFKGTFTNDDFSDFLLGLPGESDLDNVTMDNDGRSHRFAFFAQDSFRVNPRLTLEYGLRWEYHPGYTDASGQDRKLRRQRGPARGGRLPQRAMPASWRSPLPPVVRRLPELGRLRASRADPASANGAPCTPVRQQRRKRASPRGCATTLETLHAALGLRLQALSETTRPRCAAASALTRPRPLGSVYYSLTGTLQAYTNTYYNTLTNGAPAFAWPETSAGAAAGAEYGTAYFGTANSIHWKEPYSVQWNLSVERDLGFGTGLRLSYIGTKTTNLRVGA